MEQQQNFENQNVPQGQKGHKKDDGKGSLIGGVILITLGVIFLLDRFIPRIDFGDLWPLILVVAGILLLRNAYVKPNGK
jgi:hypothetical protein